MQFKFKSHIELGKVLEVHFCNISSGTEIDEWDFTYHDIYFTNKNSEQKV